MDKELLTLFLSRGDSVNKIAIALGKSPTTVRYWMKKYELLSSRSHKVDWSEHSVRKAVIGSKSLTEVLINLNSNLNGSAQETLKRKSELYGIELPSGRKEKRPSGRGARIDGLSYAKVKELQKSQRDAKRLFVCEYLVANPCIDCGEKDILVLDFDHRIADTKRSTISVLVNGGYSLRTLKEEILKCDVRCSNCHRRITTDRAGGSYRTEYLASVSALGPNE